MKCKYLVYRREKGLLYKFCKLNKERNCQCYGCDNKEYRVYEKKKKIRHQRTKKTDIQKGVKAKVWERDNYSCIFCHASVDIYHANAHLIPRSQGGLGIEENIFTACDECHKEQDNGLNTLKMEKKAEKYLKSKYKNWKKENLIYRKEY